MPIETIEEMKHAMYTIADVAFTPKGGCPLKHFIADAVQIVDPSGSIHPQGWVPIETMCFINSRYPRKTGSIHPQGWVPIETKLSTSHLRGARLQ